MKVKPYLFLIPAMMFLSCADTNNSETSQQDTTSQNVINAEGAENNAYNLPGSDTAAIHENTSTPGVLDKDAADSSQPRQISGNTRQLQL